MIDLTMNREALTRNIQKATKHQALSDIEESIEELQYYRREILKI